MPNQSGKVVLLLILLLLILVVVAPFFLPSFKQQEYIESSPAPPIIYKDSQGSSVLPGIKKYTSSDLKITLEYPDSWFVNEKDFDLMISSFLTKFGTNDQPKNDQIKLFVNNFNGCFETIDKNLVDPACGEGGSDVKPNEIVSKETEDLNGGKFHKYLVKYPSGKEQKFYFLEKGDRILQIDKNPDPSVFDKEFEDIIKSIKFI